MVSTEEIKRFLVADFKLAADLTEQEADITCLALSTAALGILENRGFKAHLMTPYHFSSGYTQDYEDWFRQQDSLMTVFFPGCPPACGKVLLEDMSYVPLYNFSREDNGAIFDREKPTRDKQQGNSRVSIVIISDNSVHMTLNAISSVVGQTFTDFELLVIDRESTDATPELLRENEFCLDYWCSEPFADLSAAADAGLEQATGDYVIFLFPGTALANADVLMKVFGNLDSAPDIIYGHSLCSNIGERKTLLQRSLPFSFVQHLLAHDGLQHFKKMDYDKVNLPRVHQIFFKRSLLSNDNLESRIYEYCEDLSSLFKLLGNGFRYQHVPVAIADIKLGSPCHVMLEKANNSFRKTFTDRVVKRYLACSKISGEASVTDSGAGVAEGVVAEEVSIGGRAKDAGREKRVAVIDHSYHRKTISTRYVPDLFSRYCQVDLYWDDSWEPGGLEPDWQYIAELDYDYVVIYQQINDSVMKYFNKSNTVLIPMYDNSHAKPENTFPDKARYYNHSSTMHERLRAMGRTSTYEQYFLNPVSFEYRNRDFSELRGFLWERTSINWETISPIINIADFKHLHIHQVIDPGGYTISVPPKELTDKGAVTVTDWFEHKSDFFATLNNANVFFAPRPYEGIGLALLEAMNMGMCVIAPNNPTMNEYIKHGVNGLLYDLRKNGVSYLQSLPEEGQERLDLSRAEELGRAARRTVEEGFTKWLEGIGGLFEYVTGIAPADWDFAPMLNVDTRQWLAKMSQLRPTKALAASETMFTVVLVNDGEYSETELYDCVASIIGQSFLELSLFACGFDKAEFPLADYVSEWLPLAEDGMLDIGTAQTGEYIMILKLSERFVAPDVLQKTYLATACGIDVMYGESLCVAEPKRASMTRTWPLNYMQHEFLTGEIDSASLEKHFPHRSSVVLKREFLVSSKLERIPLVDVEFAKTLWRCCSGQALFFQLPYIVAVTPYLATGFAGELERVENYAACYQSAICFCNEFMPRMSQGTIVESVVTNSRMVSFPPPTYRFKKIIKMYLSLKKSGLFFEEYYCRMYPEVKATKIPPLLHYIMYGAYKGYAPNPLFDSSWYLQNNPDVRQFGLNPLLHYMMSGHNEGRDPHPEFSVNFYRLRNPDVAAINIDPLRHYLTSGYAEGRRINEYGTYVEVIPEKVKGIRRDIKNYIKFRCKKFWSNILLKDRCKIKAQIKQLRNSGLFMSSYYLENNPDVKELGMDPFRHYLLSGAYEGRNPNPLFDSAWYLEQNPDIVGTDINPLLHYHRFGWREGRDPHPKFSSKHYLIANPDVAEKGVDPLLHYLKYGVVECRRLY